MKNIPKLMLNTKLTRRELHSFYILYKILCEITAIKIFTDYSKYIKKQKINNIKIEFEEGLDFDSYLNCMPELAYRSEEYSKKIFQIIDDNYSGFLNWSEFLQLMMFVKTKTLEDKLDLFIQVADPLGIGYVTKQEVCQLSRLSLSKFIEEEGVLEILSQYFAKLIFGALNFEENQKIPLKAIKQAILMVIIVKKINERIMKKQIY